jgi:L-fuconolactonase
MRIDSHQHFWKYDPAEYPWIRDDWPVRRDCLPPELQALLIEAELNGSIAVQARQSLDETRWLLRLAEEHSFIKGVVGWVDLRAEHAARQLDELSNHSRFVGVRHVAQDEPDDHFLIQPDFLRGLALLESRGLVYDLLVYPRQLPASIEVARRFPGQSFVLDHIAKPFIRDGKLSPWREQIRELARFPNVSCKISGLVTEADWTAWQPEDFGPYLEVVFEAFGPERLMFGSDWPVCLLAGTYAQVFELMVAYAVQLSPRDRAKLFGENATRIYKLHA